MRWLLLVLLAACGEPAAATCTLPGGVPLDVSARPDGLYAVHADRVAAVPFAHFDSIERTAKGVDESGKPWIRLSLDPDSRRALRDLSERPGHSIAVISGGELASQHKLREPLTSSELTLSCCNPAACDRWLALVR